MIIDWFVIAGVIIAGLSTGLGAVPIYFKKEISKKALDVGLGFSAGVMLVASFISLIIPSIHESNKIFGYNFAIFVSMTGVILGYLFILIVHEFIPHEHLFKKNDMHHDRRMSRVTLIVLAISLHNFPEGLAVGVGFGTGDTTAGFSLALAIALQNMPEGLVVAFGLLREGTTKNKAFLMAVLSGLVEPVAALIGFASTTVSVFALPVSMGFAGGTMLFIICQEIFPELFKQGHEKPATLGVVIGLVSMLTLDYYL